MVNFAVIATTLVGTLLLPGAVLGAPVDPVDHSITDRYIVTLKPGVTMERRDAHLDRVASLHKRSLGRRDLPGTESTVDIEEFHAYYGKFDDATVEEIKRDPDVAAVEPDQIWTTSAEVTQNGSTWGLAAVSHHNAGFDSYIYDDTVTGADMYAYVIDSGININHVDFGGRAVRGYNAWGGVHTDVSGHGTHVAGTIGSKTYGVFKDVNLIDVKVLSGSSTTTAVVLEAYTWSVNDILAKSRTAKSVINMSLSARNSDAYSGAIAAAYNAGVLSVVAAGNDNLPSSTRSPGSAPEAITVGAIASDWTEAEYSNYGPSVDVLAPGSHVLSTYIGSNTATFSMSGTSSATPHVAGLALYLMARDGLSSPAAVADRIKELATPNAATLRNADTPNLVAFNGNSLV
ncbi:hypothetical protein MCOR27_010082 [Pyricularia oryzae]|uniref:Uncharacterized protein n=1 Tax=Pyricularia grisea TaxID=148305 RepID=A0ABQ8NQW8_PYRGI|nr:hypothetical protein MCOR01_009844 [Pyricularia oryzae]KAI6299878.1 hypothetical protein MCOR33_004266 [Pyricularia grisea]KAH9436855.1 hypothetical protein MCOR02_000517 [Pyricularia oryzae]KAI6253404.1 hypothetical protein MCOR19_010039 [Pyricularia oryzae]KAI6266100.1 hypothetical protein MCOR26_010382 [Pyricularia oryzae]